MSSSSSLTPRSSSSSSSRLVKRAAASNSAKKSSKKMISTTPRQSATAAAATFCTPQKTPSSGLVSTNMTTLHEDDNRLYLQSLELLINTNITWSINVGDLACVQIERGSDNNTPNNSCNKGSPFFQTAAYYYQPIQILSIYQERQKTNKLSSSKKFKKKRYSKDVQVEVRYFYRNSDLDIETQQRLLIDSEGSNDGDEVILESDHVEVVHASFLLGCLVLNAPPPFYYDTDATNNNNTSVPTVTMSYNHQLYRHQEQDVLQFDPLENTMDKVLLRGIKASRVMVENEEVRLKTCTYLNLLTMMSDNSDDSNNNDSNNGGENEDNQALSDPSLAATVALDDTAFKAPAASTTPKQRRSKRAKTPISKSETGSDQSTKQKRPKRGEVAATTEANDNNHVSATSASIRSLLTESPAATPGTATRTRRSKRGKSPSVSAEEEAEQPELKPKKRKQSASLSEEMETPDENDDLQEDEVETLRVKCPSQPYHVDVSSQKSFYEKIDIQPPIDSYDDRFSKSNNDDDLEWWTVRLGDMVSIEVEHAQKVMGLVTFPFAVTWAPAEIVSIYRVHDSKAECLELREKLQRNNRDLNDESFFGDVMVEVRWFYRKHEIPGAGGKSSKSQGNDGEELEEIFETDQIDSCPAECLLSPIKLFEASRPEESLPSVVSGMPCIYYHCRRYWSIHRKSFIPSGLLSNRIERGRMHSKYKAALSKLTLSSSNNGKKSSEGYSWKEGFQSAIQKLSLAEAAADVQVHGMELRCREKERRHIGSFLRKAIRGLEQPLNNTQDDDDSASGGEEGLMNTKSSIFICGPPGTGKTASVRSIINELQEEQASGKLPEFNFIALNGMEMRSPFDSYVKFWEALSGTMKERLSAGAAAAKLEEFFGDSDNDDRNEDRTKPVTVLMLDEIDYLVTKKQTILYNFFDWPLRATKARLIVIGISNTINLPERLSMKLQSRLGGERCHFKSYTVDETVAILKTRLDGDASQVFDEDAIKFASRKTGNLSGDIRKAFQMCKVAAQNALDDYASGRRRIVEGSHPKVKISDVQRGSRDMYTSIIHKAISCSSSYEALVLIAIGALKKAKVGKDIISLDVQEMLTKIESIANGSGEERYLSARLSLGDLLGILSRLGDAGILTLTTPKHSNNPWPLIQTSLEPYEINSSYRNTPHSKLAEKHLAEQRLF